MLQDTNALQYGIARQMASVHGNIFVVGDPDQSIYSWRFADASNMDSLQRDFAVCLPGSPCCCYRTPDTILHAHTHTQPLRIIKLEQNYRSTAAILACAHAVIAASRKRDKKQLWTDNAQVRRSELTKCAAIV